MCKESETQSQTVSTVPGYVTDASRTLAGQATDLATRPFEAFTGDRVAGFSPDQTNAFQMLRDYISGAPNVLPEALEGARTYASAPAQVVGTERVVDESGQLGAISDYLNPYVDAALNPVIRRITEEADKRRIALGNRAQSAGAFGDQRHGVLESEINEDTNQAIGDVAGRFYMDAFDKALGLRTGDVNRFYNADVTSANLAERALDRTRTGTGDLLTRAQQDQQTMLNQLGALLGYGSLQQGVEQAELDAAYQEFLREYQDSFDVVRALSAALSGLPFERTQTTTATQPDNSLLGLAGSLAGAFLGGPPGAAIGGGIGGSLAA